MPAARRLAVPALLLGVLVSCSQPRSPIDNAFGTTAPHYLIASGTEHGRSWAFYAGVNIGGSPSIGYSNDIFGGGGENFLVRDGFSAPDLADGRPISGTVRGTDGIVEPFDAVVGFAPPSAAAIVLRTPDGESTRTAALHVPGIGAVRFFVFTGAGITSSGWDLAVYNGSGKLLRAECAPSNRIPCPSPPPTAFAS